MPLIEELPLTAGANTRTSHGWAYVPDTGFDSSKTAIGPSAPRNKRLARDASIRKPYASASDTTAKQQKAIAAKLADLEKENWKDGAGNAAVVAVPGGVGVTKTKGKATPNVRKILTSGRTFMHFLNDYEAELAQQPTPAAIPSAASTSTPAPSRSSASTPAQPNPLLTSQTPKPPSTRVLAHLLTEPPLTYPAARGGPSKQGLPPRHFCAICGYWGKVKCRRCGERTCGDLACWRGHLEGGCGVEGGW